MTLSSRIVFLLVVLGMAIGVPSFSVSAQLPASPGIDMMVLIDNSCSMFPAERTIPGCDVWGSDPDFLRVVGVHLFLARLGFTEPNEEAYQIGVIGFGEQVRTLLPLMPVSQARDSGQAEALFNVSPELATRIVPAIERAIQELRQSPRPENQPAIVIFTDGVPYPPDEQPFSRIEALLAQNPDIPVFVMLLQVSSTQEELDQYVRFWERVSQQYPHVSLARIQDRGEIEAEYNRIISKLQNTVPEEQGVDVGPNEPYTFFVGSRVRRIIVTVIYRDVSRQGQVIIKDSQGVPVQIGEPGVRYSYSSPVSSLVEAIAIAPPRLAPDLVNTWWTVESDQLVRVFLDRRGNYSVKFLAPQVAAMRVANQYLVQSWILPEEKTDVRFQLVDDETGEQINDPNIVVNVTSVLPNGVEVPIATQLQPDGQGMYTFSFVPSQLYLPITNQPGTLQFKVQSGEKVPDIDDILLFTQATLHVRSGPVPRVTGIRPESVRCEAAQQDGQLELILENTDVITEGQAALTLDVEGAILQRSALSSGQISVTLPLQEVCEQVSTQFTTPCGETARRTLSAFVEINKIFRSPGYQVPLEVVAAACTPTPLPSPTPTPRPVAPPPPDTDRDAIADPYDACPDQQGWSTFEGCPPPLWVWAVLAVGSLLILAILWFLWRELRIRYIAPPPRVYLSIFKGTRLVKGPIFLHDVGMRHKTNRILVGNDPKAHIRVGEMEAVTIRQPRRDSVVLEITTGGRPPRSVRLNQHQQDDVKGVSLQNGQFELRFGLDPQARDLHR